MKLAIICGRCNDGTLATTYVSSPSRREIACDRHRPAVEAWARGGGPITTTPVCQPDDAEPPAGHQHALFNL